MPEDHLPAPSSNPVTWGKWLLPASLLAVAIVGFFQLYAVQAVFFPGKYHRTQLRLINQEYSKIEEKLQDLERKVCDLQQLATMPEQLPPGSAERSSAGSATTPSAGEGRPNSSPGWQAALHAAKKERVYAARKLKQIDVILNSMQRALESQDATVSLGKLEPEQTLAQIRLSRARYQLYVSQLKDLSEKLTTLAQHRASSPPIE
jgi:hypothetical protein